MVETCVSKKYEFILDLDKGYQSESLTLIQASNNVRRFEVQLTKEESPFDLTNCVVKAMYYKSDDTMVLNNVNVIEPTEGHIQVGLTEQCLAEEGRVRCEIIVIDILNESFITFPIFNFKAKASLFASSNIESTDEFLTLTEAIVRVESFDVIGQEKLDQLDVHLEVAQGKLDEVQLLHKMVSDTLNNVIDIEEQSNNKLNLIENIHMTCQDLKNNVELIREQSNTIQKEMVTFKESSTTSHNDISKLKELSQKQKTLIDVMATDIKEVEILVADILVDVVNHKDSSESSLKRIKTIASETEALLKTITERSNNANQWSASINNILTNSNYRYNEIVKLKGDALNQISDIAYYSSLAKIELGNMEQRFNDKLQEFEDRFNELINRG